LKESIEANKTKSTDARLEVLNDWLLNLGYADFSLAPASQDASFRRYFRMTRNEHESLIVMDAPPEKEALSPFIEISQDWHTSDISVPEIFDYSRELGFLILEDFGNVTFLNQLSDSSLESSYHLAIDELINIQMHTGGHQLPEYSKELLLVEMSLFIDWFVIRHCGYELLPKERQTIEHCFTKLMLSATDQKQIVVHRDYHSRNLMIKKDQTLGVIDFQDAVYGPLTYDLVSLLKDCYYKMSKQQREALLSYYQEQAISKGLLANSCVNKFRHDFTLMGVQRHLKAIGILSGG